MRSFRSLSSVARALPRKLSAGVATAMLLTIISFAGVAPVAAQDRPPGGEMANPVVRAIDLATPAVVRIATLYSAHLRLTACGVTTSLPSSGAYTIGGLGSGAFVSANGDILTADHVVDIDRQSLDNSIFGGERVATDVAAFLNAACHPSVPVTANDVANGIVQYNGLPFSTTYSEPQVLVWRSASYFGAVAGGSGDATNQLSGLMKATYSEATVLQTSSFEQDDVALIHVGMTDTPSIQLDPSTELAVEDALTVIGFPGNGDVNGDPTNLLTPSVNNVNVSAIKRNDNGSQLIQVGGNVEHGDSGGPALDAAGHIVGIVSFGGSDSQGITAFLRSSDSALKLMRNANIDTTPGTFQKLWEQAFTAYADTKPGHWRTASRELDSLASRYPEFHGLDSYRAYADSAALREAPTSPAFQPPALPLPLPIMAAIAGVIVLFLLALIITVSLRSRARRRARQAQQQAAAVAQPAWTPAALPQGYSGYNGSSAQNGQSGYAGYSGYSGYGGYSGYNGQPNAPTTAPGTPGAPGAPTYAPTNGAAAYGAQAQPTRPATGQARPEGYPPQTSRQQYPAPAAAPTPFTPTYAPQYPGYPPRSNPPAPSSGLPAAPAAPAAASPSGLSAPSSASGVSQPGAVAPNTYDSRPAPSGPSSPSSSPSSSPAPASFPSQATPAQNGAASEFCVNGHQMSPGAPRCLVCGADRAQPAPSAPRDASVPPWGQSW